MIGKLTLRDYWKMAVYSSNKHKNQFYGDKAYDYHLQGVAAILSDMGGDLEQVIIALGHDLLEDTDATYQEIHTMFGSRVVDGIYALTKCEDETYEDYIEGVKQNKDALLVKKADALFNLTESVKGGDSRRIKKYAKALLMLEE